MPDPKEAALTKAIAPPNPDKTNYFREFVESILGVNEETPTPPPAPLPPHERKRIDPRQPIRIQDQRPDATPRANYSGEYDPKIIEELARSAGTYGVNPYTAIAMGLQESLLGRTNPVNVLHNNQRLSPRMLDMRQRIMDEAVGRGQNRTPEERQVTFDQLRPSETENSILHMVNRAKDLGIDPNSPRGIQSYNGLGKPSIQDYGGRMYGQATKSLSPNFYADRVGNLRQNAIENNPKIRQLVEGLTTKPLEPDQDATMALSPEIERFLTPRRR